jgi:hypothetical protein
MKVLYHRLTEKVRTDLKEMDNVDLEANREKLEAIAEHQEVPNKEAAVEMIGALKDQSGDWHLAVRYCGWLALHAVPAQCKGHSHKGLTVEKRR